MVTVVPDSLRHRLRGLDGGPSSVTIEHVVSHIHGRLPWRWRMFGRPKGKRNPFAVASIYMKSRIFSCKGTRGSRPSRAFAFIRQNKDGSSLSRGATSLRL